MCDVPNRSFGQTLAVLRLDSPMLARRSHHLPTIHALEPKPTPQLFSHIQ